MTVHIAFSGTEGAVILSDSQGSDSISESHGFQKQYVGDGFIIGCAGHGGIIRSLLTSISKSSANESNIAQSIEDYLENELRPSAVGTIRLLLVRTAKGSDAKIAEYSPDTYRHFSSNNEFGSIGSGAHFVQDALNRHGKLGIEMPTDSLADMFVMATYYADAANESLTVDDFLMASFIKNDRCYLTGANDIRVIHAPPKAIQNWNTISNWYEELVLLAKTVNNEVREATRLFSKIRISALDPSIVHAIKLINKAIHQHRHKLGNQIDDFCNWYDANIR